MFSSKGGSASKGGSIDYRQVNLDEFSDDDSDNDVEYQRNTGNGACGGGGGGGTAGRVTPPRPPPTASTTATSMSGQDRIQTQLQQQDEGLEMLSQSADRLNKMSLAISDELGQHNKMLDEMDEGMDHTVENLGFVTKTTKDFIEKSGGTKNFLIILALSVIVFILLILIIYF